MFLCHSSKQSKIYQWNRNFSYYCE